MTTQALSRCCVIFLTASSKEEWMQRLIAGAANTYELALRIETAEKEYALTINLII